MKKQIILTLTAAMAAVLVSPAWAADLTAPGTPGTETLALQSSASLQASPKSDDGDYIRQAARQAQSVTAWKLSLAPLLASQALDAYSSRGLHELNPVLAGSGGEFGEKAMLLKAGIAGALIGVEYLVVRKHPGAAKLLWKINVASAAVTGGVAAHNLSLH
jgi:hypothetical protein